MKRFIRKGLGISAAIFGTGGSRVGRTFLYSFAAIAVLVGVVNVINVISIQHNEANQSLFGPVIGEGSSWLSLILFLWIPWLAWRLAPPGIRPRWKLFLHLPAAAAFAFAHVAFFDFLRVLAFGLVGKHYEIGSFPSQLRYEAAKDVFAYVLFIGLFSLIDHLLRRPGDTPIGPQTFDIRDGAKLTRVKLDEILAVSSAGNYVQFFLADGRHLLMRSALRSVENALAPRGFVRTHRSWLVNGKKVTTLKPDGSGDYTVELGRQAVPLSRRFPDALAKLRDSP
ncbi:MAG TPA: LytTR family DNA-binding domain-containing protein [Rhizomicrobium sp.]|jgi:DNA-binding LytR/AlgR family response regulator|nr:LytTR family DNA-binding domain-containing protein [Rhizomicrobium sp.]